MRRRHPSLTLRTLTSLVGLFFIYSITVAQLPHCQCGIQCLHVGMGESLQAVSPVEEPDHSCCPSGKQGDAPAPKSASEMPCEDVGEPCPCPVEVREDTTPPATKVATSVEYTPLKLAPALPIVDADSLLFSVIAGDNPRWIPIRGSPSSRPPLNLLYSIFII
jgi:hypothetical protein